MNEKMKINLFSDPVVCRWFAFCYDQNNSAEDTGKVLLQMLKGLSAVWYKDGIKDGMIPTTETPFECLTQIVQNLPKPDPLNFSSWRFSGEELRVNGRMYRISLFVVSDCIVLAVETGREVDSLDSIDVENNWDYLSSELSKEFGQGQALGFWEHRIVEYSGDLAHCLMNKWNLRRFEIDGSLHFLSGQHPSKPEMLAVVHGCSDDSRLAADDFFREELFLHQQLAAIKLSIRGRKQYMELRKKIDKLPKPTAAVPDSLTLEKLDELANSNAKNLDNWQDMFTQFSCFRSTLEANLWNLKIRDTSHPCFPSVFLQLLDRSESLLKQVEVEEVRYKAMLDGFNTVFQVGNYRVQMKDAKYSRSLNQIFVCLGFLATMLSLGQIYVDILKKYPIIHILFLLSIFGLAVTALLQLRSSGRTKKSK